MTLTTGPSPIVGLVAALVVLVGGVAAAFSKDDSTATTAGPAITTIPRVSISTTTSTTRTSSVTTLPSTTLPATTTTVRAAVPSPEAAANGLWAAYSSGNQTAASRFATDVVVNALFANEYSGEEGTFGSCRKQSEGVFDCDYAQPSAHYVMTAQADANNSFKIVMIEIVTTPTTSTDSFSS